MPPHSNSRLMVLAMTCIVAACTPSEENREAAVSPPVGVTPLPRATLPREIDVGLAQGENVALPLVPSAGASLVWAVTGESGRITGIAPLIGTYGAISDGRLQATLCSPEQCVSGAAALSAARDNQKVWISLDGSLTVADGSTLMLTLQNVDATQPVALWTYAGQADGFVVIDSDFAGRSVPVALRIESP